MSYRLQFVVLESRIVPADLRIVTYNILAETGLIREGMVAESTSQVGILDTIGVQNVNGVVRPIDVLLVQEASENLVAVNTLVANLNAYYGPGTYAAGNVVGKTLGNGVPGIVYRNDTVDLLEQLPISKTSLTGAARQPVRYKLKLDGTTTEFYIYNSHMKAENTPEDAQRRLVEAQAIRANADTLPADTPILYCGDYNMYGSGVEEPAYGHFLSAGKGQAQDVANPANNWVRNSNSFVSLYTQAPLNNPPPGFVGGGLDDRFDFILMSTDLSDGSGLEYRPGSYRVFGNNGSIGKNIDINIPSNTALNNTPLNITQRQTVLNYLTTVSDHLPVVADFTFPTPPPPPSGPTAVTTYAINGGTQRSRVTSITITFNANVPSLLTAANFSLTGFTGVLGVAHTINTSVAVLTFSGAGTLFGSINDGTYTLNVNLTGVTTNTTFNFHRLYGDGNGDGTVDGTDFGAFGALFGSTVVDSPFDYEGNGTIDGGDFGAFGARFGLSI